MANPKIQLQCTLSEEEPENNPPETLQSHLLGLGFAALGEP
jgi:hypothetical protein